LCYGTEQNIIQSNISKPPGIGEFCTVVAENLKID